MTKEQRLELLKQIEKQIYVPSLESTLHDDLKSVAINSIIEEETERIYKKKVELKQEPVLDKIRSEIEASKWTDKDLRIERNALTSGLDKALEIIDKYDAESEDDE